MCDFSPQHLTNTAGCSTGVISLKPFLLIAFYIGVGAPIPSWRESDVTHLRDKDVPASWSAEDSSRSGWSFCPPPPETIGTMRKVRRTTRIRRFTAGRQCGDDECALTETH